MMRVAAGDDLAQLLAEAEPDEIFELEAGTHVVLAPLVVTVPVTLRGERGGAVLRGGPDGPLLVLMADDGVVEVENLALVRDEDGSPHDVVHVAAGECRFLGCRFAGGRRRGLEGGHGFSVGGWARARLNACVAEGCEEAGLAVMGDAHVDAEGCVFRRNGIGARFGERSTGVVRDCTAERNARFGFLVADHAKPTLVSNVIRENGAPGVAVVDDARPLVVDNRLDAADMGEPEVDPDEDLKNPETVLKLVGVASVTLELGLDLVPLVDPAAGGDLMDRVVPMRVNVAMELGFVMPGVQFKDNLNLRPTSYRVLVKGTQVAEGEVVLDALLAVETVVTDASVALEGQATTDPLTGRPAVWVSAQEADRAQALGWQLHDVTGALIAHVEQVMRANAHEILSRDEVQLMLDRQRERTPKAVTALVPERMSLGEVHQVLARLLREQVSVRDLGTVIEALADAAYTIQEPDLLAEAVRKRLARQICAGLANERGEVPVVFFDAETEHKVDDALELAPDTPVAEVFRRQALVTEAVMQLFAMIRPGHGATLVVSPALRPRLADFLTPRLARVPVLAADELHPSFRFIDARG